MLIYRRLYIFCILLICESYAKVLPSEPHDTNATALNANNTAKELHNDTVIPRQGWTSAPNARGTIDIIWSCCVTLFLCCWTVLCINLPKPGSSKWQVLSRKIWLTGLCAICPDLILQVSIGQFLSARRAMILFQDDEYTDWTLRHSFYADMGGIVLQPREWEQFPVDAHQLHYLVKNKYVEYPRIPLDCIEDKNKVDGLLRFITLIQTVWFIINLIARALEGLVITALELSTSAFILCAVATTFCWWRKPADIRIPDVVTSEYTMHQILEQAGPAAAGVYNRTPMDFANRNEWGFSILWLHGLRIFEYFNIASPPAVRPIDRFQNSIPLPVDGISSFLFGTIGVGYFGIFVAGWNFSFPTKIEQTLWRAASITSLISASAVFLTIKICFNWYPKLRAALNRTTTNKAELPQKVHEPKSSQTTTRRPQGRLARVLAKIRNNSALKDPHLAAPFKAVAATWFFGIFYCSSRAYIWVADFVELRSLPLSAYRTVNWWQLVPHVG